LMRPAWLVLGFVVPGCPAGQGGKGEPLTTSSICRALRHPGWSGSSDRHSTFGDAATPLRTRSPHPLPRQLRLARMRVFRSRVLHAGHHYGQKAPTGPPESHFANLLKDDAAYPDEFRATCRVGDVQHRPLGRSDGQAVVSAALPRTGSFSAIRDRSVGHRRPNTIRVNSHGSPAAKPEELTRPLLQPGPAASN